MQKLLRLCFLLSFAASSVFAASNYRLGDVVLTFDSKTVPVRVSASTPVLNDLALRAFGVHGRYRLVASGYTYDIKFSLVTSTQVRVDITQGKSGTPVASEVVNGRNESDALLRAADVAVVKTNGLGLKGFFTAKLAFIGGGGGKREVYTSDLFFRHVTQVTHDNALALFPRWSPDGAKLLYTSFYKSGFPDIFQIDLNTYQRTSFVSFKGTNGGARYSPSGGQVAMVLSGEGTPEIYISNAQGRSVSRKTHSATSKSSPCWSPDGSRLVFAMEPGPQLYVMSAAGGTPSRLVTGFTYAAEPDWNRVYPNKIACTVRSGSYQIAVYDMAAGRAEIVSKAPFDAIEASWLGDGRHMVYTARDRTTSVLCVLDTVTGSSRAISPTSFGPAMQASVYTP
ncbi:MAG: biopolymer transporter Tol [Opitutaceae bacterium]